MDPEQDTRELHGSLKPHDSQEPQDFFGDRKRSELIRKGLHFLIALAPVLAVLHKPFTLVLLITGTAAYTVMEYLRRRGFTIPVISSLTVAASRRRDMGRFVLGPVTLGIGAILPLLLFPPQIAAIAIYALAFGDGTASLAGKFLGRVRPRMFFGKSLEGSLACFLGVLFSAYLVTFCYGNKNWHTALIAAITATAAEVIPVKDWDNVIIPLAVGLIMLFVI